MQEFVIVVDGTNDAQSCENEAQAQNLAKAKCSRVNRPVVLMQVIGTYNPGEPVFVPVVAAQQPAPAPAFAVGERVEVEFRPSEWIAAEVIKLNDSETLPYHTRMFNPEFVGFRSFGVREIRRPVTVAAEPKALGFGVLVKCGRSYIGTDFRGTEGVVIASSPDDSGDWRVALRDGKRDEEYAYFKPDQLHPI